MINTVIWLKLSDDVSQSRKLHSRQGELIKHHDMEHQHQTLRISFKSAHVQCTCLLEA